ncbi:MULTISPECIES: TetR/AcrR family transcriptional regulator [unclassified Salinibacterium]|uniref:TetR/AcrR family transcriptional regulator n=1 Tax=unclassified Salinibacterium TaxID=2632331 RepID=UPI0018CDA7C4|nr:MULTISPECIES: TetR/AcrR family transcriptional regulator [unclassified Salinibacterium]MBH0053870.1 TetR/AcrR family transcriptional regulator [Salinibacterium sp. SWN139]MBH0083130.1 TetR/AcrR family transcriptional regulator [Salinibacterium sp. SWN167]
MNETPTLRSQAKADRREALLDAAASLFAERGFTRVSLEELGAAAGVSGPAVYRHFDGKQDVLAAILVDASSSLCAGAQTVIEHAPTARAALENLVQFHVEFALRNANVIRVQDRDLDSLTDDDRHEVRALQRSYVEQWVATLARLHPDAATTELRTRAHATFGLINSTPHSGRAGATRDVLERMALAALDA